jgi:hypothetical protein
MKQHQENQESSKIREIRNEAISGKSGMKQYQKKRGCAFAVQGCMPQGQHVRASAHTQCLGSAQVVEAHTRRNQQLLGSVGCCIG